VTGVQLELLLHEDHYPAVIDRVLSAQRSVWIATANLKELMIEDAQLVPGRRRGRRRFRSVLSAFGELAARGVELRILHAALPSRVFQRDFDRQRTLVQGGLQLRLCPRTHLKLVIVDGEHLYLGSANWTGAGLGAKHADRRNFELGLLTRDERLLDAAQEAFEHIWRGKACASCRLREECPMPLDVFALKPPQPTQPEPEPEPQPQPEKEAATVAVTGSRKRRKKAAARSQRAKPARG
jgi:phosphatidylserine/phosphatidylglycerophosphate/cardiolipin synthase-like enzyme